MKVILQFRFSFIFLTILFISVVSVSAVAQQQTPSDWIRQFDGIPIIASLDYDWAIPNHNIDVDKMKFAGIDAVILSIANGTKVNSLGSWINGGFRVIPIKSIKSSGDTLNWITYYTDAKYTVWETEDITPEDTSYIQHDSTIMDEVTQGSDTFLKLRSSAAGNVDTLIWGPYYSQHVFEKNPAGLLDTAFYTADFRMKLKLNNGYADNIHPDTPLCVIQVTQSSVSTSPNWHLPCTYVIKERVITRVEFGQLDQFDDFKLDPNNLLYDYDLLCDSCYSTPTPPPVIHFINDIDNAAPNDIQLDALKQRHYIQFRVFWLGKPNYLLSIDKITVYDQKGLRLLVSDTLQTKSEIEDQLNTLSPSYDNNITGWLGIDEPNSIDMYAPIKRVIQILKDNSNNQRPLWLTLMGKWDGVWENSDNPFGTYHLSPWKEMKKRIGSMNVWQDVYYLDYPWNSSECLNCTEPWYSENIKIAAELNYKQAYDLDNYFGVSIQCGEIHIDGVAEQRDILPSDLLYETNLALMYGAKFLSLYTYFAQVNIEDDTSKGTKHAIVDFRNNVPEYTVKYNMLRDTISPRLSGLMGNTLKKLTPSNQILKVPLNTQFSFSNFINKIIKGACTSQGSQPGEYDYDLGFFKDTMDTDYFMILSRWYNAECNPSLTININPLSFPDNYNLKVIDLIDNTSSTITKYGHLSTAIEVGDASFFRVAPVVKYGGIIAYNDTIKTNTSLIDNMTINDSKTIIINYEKVYTIQDTVTLIGTGFITGDGYINLPSTGEIIINNWNYSLFKSRNDNHPKLVWGKYPGSYSVSYYSIFRKIGTGNWQFLANTSNRNYTDTYLTIVPPGGQAGTTVYYKILAVFSNETESQYSNTVEYDCTSKQIEKKSGGEEIIYTYDLAQNYPNPFNPVTTINYSLAEDGDVELDIVDILGRRVAVLSNEFQTKGSHTINFDASEHPSGVYFYKLQAGDFISSKKMILLK